MTNSRPDFLHYQSIYGIIDVLYNYTNESEVEHFLQKGLSYGAEYKLGKIYAPSIMILDTFLSDDADKALLKKIINDPVRKNFYNQIHILLANPYGYFAEQRHKNIDSENRYETPILKTIKGLKSILVALSGEGSQHWLLGKTEMNDDEYCAKLLEAIRETILRKQEDRITIKFYDDYPRAPMYFFNDILIMGAFGANVNCMQLPWFMVVNDPLNDNLSDNSGSNDGKIWKDLFDQNRNEFKEIWNNAMNDPKKWDNLNSNADDSICDVAIICALDIELKAVREMGQLTSKKWDWKPLAIKNDSNFYHTTNIKTSNNSDIRAIVATQNQMGSVPSSCLTTTVLHRFSPKMVIMVGITAGISSDKVHHGDIIVAQCAFDYASGKASVNDSGESRFEADPHPIQIWNKLESKIKEFNQNKEYLFKIKQAWRSQSSIPGELKVHVGPIGTADIVVSDPRISEKARELSRKMLGLEMETYGVYFAAFNTFNSSPLYCSFKSVSDFADQNKSDEYQEYAAYTAAEYCNYFLVNCYDSLIE